MKKKSGKKANPVATKLSKAKRMTLQEANAQDNLQIKKGKGKTKRK